MTKKLPSEVKLSRKPIKTACTFCHSKHLQCDETRPCKNCVKRGVEHDCKDAERKKSKSSSAAKKRRAASTENGRVGVGSTADNTLLLPEAKVKNPRGRKRKIDLVVPTITTKSTDSSIAQGESHQQQNHTGPIESMNYSSPSQTHRGILVSPTPPLPVSLTPSSISGSTAAPTPTNLQHQILQNSGNDPNNTNKHTHLESPGLEIKTGRSTFIPPAYLYNQQKRSLSNNNNSNNNVDNNGQQRRHSQLHPDPSPTSVHSTSEILSTASDMLSTTSQSSSMKPFESSLANDEYTQLTDLLNTNPPSPTSAGFFEFEDDEDDDYEDENQKEKFVRQYIQINTEEDAMVSSYPNNSTPNSYIYNPKHSQMPNTAREIPNDIQEDDDYTPPLIMRHIIKHPDDIYLTLSVKAYQYPRAYHALISYLKSRFDRDQLIEIAKCMAKYRPSFISATKSLYENDLIFTERSFQRTLLEYEKLIQGSSSPTLIWRRTGEIVAMTNEFAIMTGYSKISLLSKRTFVVEIMDDESTIRYFQSFSNMAFGDLNATLLTNCVLRKANDDDYLRCACVWTIKRDVFDIPMLIVGQFLPILN